MLREGGNAVDAAVAAVLMSFVAESPLTGPGAGGFMLVHTAEGESHLLDFFVAAPGQGLDRARARRRWCPIDVTFSEGAVQRFNVGPSSCGAYGTTAGMAEALERFGTLALAGLCEAPARAAREGVEVVPMQALPVRDARPDLPLHSRGRRDLRAPEGDLLAGRRDACACPSWATCSSAWAPRARGSSTTATWAARCGLGARARRAA